MLPTKLSATLNLVSDAEITNVRNIDLEFGDGAVRFGDIEISYSDIDEAVVLVQKSSKAAMGLGLKVNEKIYSFGFNKKIPQPYTFPFKATVEEDDSSRVPLIIGILVALLVVGFIQLRYF